jgi:hypothetical protein
MGHESYANEFVHDGNDRVVGRENLPHVVDESDIRFGGDGKWIPKNIIDEYRRGHYDTRN